MTLVDVIAAVVRRGDSVLLGLRPRDKRHGGLWEFPGGKVMSGESWLDAMQRELREELDVDVASVGDSLASIQDRDSVFRVHFIPVALLGEPQAREHDELRWVAVADLGRLQLAPADREFTAAYFASECQTEHGD